MTITLKQYSTQSKALKYCETIAAELMRQVGPSAHTAVNQLDEGVFQVELTLNVIPQTLDLVLLDASRTK